MIKRQRKRQHGVNLYIRADRHRGSPDSSCADDRDLRRHHDEGCVLATQTAEIGQSDRCSPKFRRWNAARHDVGLQPRDAGAQIGEIAIADIANDGDEQAVGCIDREADVRGIVETASLVKSEEGNVERWLRSARSRYSAQ